LCASCFLFGGSEGIADNGIVRRQHRAGQWTVKPTCVYVDSVMQTTQ